jgi:hypothetical protein
LAASPLDGLTLEECPHKLKEMADWYRGMAEVGHSDHAATRRTFADYLERCAAELETDRKQSRP